MNYCKFELQRMHAYKKIKKYCILFFSNIIKKMFSKNRQKFQLYRYNTIYALLFKII